MTLKPSSRYWELKPISMSAPLTEMLRINCRPGMLKTEKYPLKNRGKLAVTLILFRDIILETCYRNNKTTKN